MKTICPLIKDECAEHACCWHVHLQGQHPQTGEVIDKYTCAIAAMPMLLIETAKQGRDAAARVDNLRELAAQAIKSSALQKPTPELLRLIGVSDG